MFLQGLDFDARQELLHDINEKIESNLQEGEVVASLSMAEYDAGSDKSFHDVFKRADGLMYQRRMQLKGMGAITRD